VLCPEIVKQCALDAAEGKLHRPEVIQFFKEFDRSYDHVIKCATDPSFKPCEDNKHTIIDGSNHKERHIEKPRFNPEQVLHHLIIEGFKPILLEGLYEQVYGCLPSITKLSANEVPYEKSFGPHEAVKTLTKWVQTGTKIYIGVTDIHHAYDSVHIGILVRMMEEVIKDQDWINLVCKFLHYDKNDPNCENVYGLVLGHYTSPWFFNFYLKKFDHFIAAIHDVKYLRYADNIFLVGTNKRKVHRAMNALKEYLKNKLQLELNKCTQVFRFEYIDPKTGKYRGRALDALGFIIHCNRIGVRKTILRGARRKANKIKNKGDNTTFNDAASMLSRLGYFKHADAHTFYDNHIKNNINIKELKNIVAAHTKETAPISMERRKIINDGLAHSERLATSNAAGI